MKLTADEFHYLTEAGDVSLKDRTFQKIVLVSNKDELTKWKQITEQEKNSLEAQQAILGEQEITSDYLESISNLIKGITSEINKSNLSDKEAIKYKDFYPMFEKLIGQEIDKGFKFNFEGDLFEALLKHNVSEDNKPSKITLLKDDKIASKETQLYKLVTI